MKLIDDNSCPLEKLFVMRQKELIDGFIKFLYDEKTFI